VPAGATRPRRRGGGSQRPQNEGERRGGDHEQGAPRLRGSRRPVRRQPHGGQEATGTAQRAPRRSPPPRPSHATPIGTAARDLAGGGGQRGRREVHQHAARKARAAAAESRGASRGRPAPAAADRRRRRASVHTWTSVRASRLNGCVLGRQVETVQAIESSRGAAFWLPSASWGCEDHAARDRLIRGRPARGLGLSRKRSSCRRRRGPRTRIRGRALPGGWRRHRAVCTPGISWTSAATA